MRFVLHICIGHYRRLGFLPSVDTAPILVSDNAPSDNCSIFQLCHVDDVTQATSSACLLCYYFCIYELSLTGNSGK